MNNKISMEKFVSMSDMNHAQCKTYCSDVLCLECPLLPVEKYPCSVEHITEKINEYKNIEENIKLVESL